MNAFVAESAAWRLKAAGQDIAAACPALDDYDLIVVHLHRHGISLSQVAGILGAAIDEARAQQEARQ